MLAFLRGLFLDKVAGSPSMARLISFLLAIDVSVLVAVICRLALGPTPSTAVLGVLAGVVTTLAGIVWGGLHARAKACASTAPEGAPPGDTADA